MESLRRVSSWSFLTCLQQSVMNFGILMVQGLVNSFGTSVMAAFAAAVKIDSFAYMPVQDFGNAFSTFIAQNFGAGRAGRIRQLLCRHRLAVPSLRTLPRRRPALDVGRTHRGVARHPRGSGIRSCRHPVGGIHRHMVVGADRLGTG